MNQSGQLLSRRRFQLALLVGLGLFGLFCWRFYVSFQNTTPSRGQDKLHVLTTFTVLADMARNVAGDRAEVNSLTKPGTEIHGYEPTPQDITTVQDADLMLDNGMNLEKWAEKLYANAPNVPHATLTDGLSPIAIKEGPYLDKPNPHAWMSPTNALTYVDNIEKAFSAADPANSGYYRANANDYKRQINEIDASLKRELNALPVSNRYLVSCEGAFSYLIRDYGLKELYLWPINADAQGTPQQIKHVVETVRSKQIPAVFCESTVNNKAQVQVAQETGARYAGVFYVDSLSGEGGPTPTYLKLLRYNADTLSKGLRGE